MKVYDSENISKLYFSPYVMIRCHEGIIEIKQNLNGLLWSVPGDEGQVEGLLRLFDAGISAEAAQIKVAEIFPEYDAQEIIESLMKLGILE